MPKRKNDLITLSKLYLPKGTCWRRQYQALQPREESEAQRLGREIHKALLERSCTPARDSNEPLLEDKE